jgi:MFS family permease
MTPAGIPWAPLLATLTIQTLATMAAYTLPASAPRVAAELGVPGPLVGFFISTVYGVGIVSAVLSPGLIRRYGAVRVGQAVLVAVLAMLLCAGAANGVLALALAACLLGSAYGATAPVATHLLVPRTPKGVMNLVLSLRQIGVPLGGVLGGLLVPPIVLWAGWREAFFAQLAPSLLLLLLLQFARPAWDADREPARPAFRGAAFAPLRLLGESAGLRVLSAVGFVYSGIQLCFIAFMAVHLTAMAGLDLIRAGQALATYQIAGAVSRPIWGWLADNVVAARWLLVLQGFVMAGAAVAAGQFGPAWPYPLILLVCAVGGATASGFTGIAYAEFARLGGERRTEATGLGAAAMFAGVMVLPSAFGVLVSAGGGYALAYDAVAGLAVLSALLLALARAERPRVAVG